MRLSIFDIRVLLRGAREWQACLRRAAWTGLISRLQAVCREIGTRCATAVNTSPELSGISKALLPLARSLYHFADVRAEERERKIKKLQHQAEKATRRQESL